MRIAAVALGACAALGTLLHQVDPLYSVRLWLFWRYLDYWLVCAGFTALCLSAGLAVCRWLGPRHLPLRELTVFGLAAGLLVFFLGTFVGGLFGGYGSVFGVAWPLAMGVAGAIPSFRFVRRAVRHVRAARRKAKRPSTVTVVATALGFVGLTMVYLNILTPDNVSYDSRWYHLALPEHYVAQHGLYRSPEGWFHSALPQLACLLYLLPYQFEWMRPFDQLMIATHLEFTVFLWTLLSIGPLVRWLVPKARAPAAWAAMFLFSGIFCYDSTLNGGSDHIAAFWAIPIYLALRRAWARFDTRSSLLLGAMLAGALETKVHAIAIVVFPCAAVGLRGLWLFAGELIALVRHRARDAERGRLAWLTGPATVAGVLLLVTTPYWLKNWIWYGDPLYPALHGHLQLRPWHEDMGQLYATLVERHFWRPQGTPLEKWKATLEVLFTFAFKPHDWPFMHRDWPVFGFLFTLSWFVMPFIGAGRRLWALFLAAHVGVAVWFRFSHQDRYLVVLVPWMAAHVAAVIARVWTLGWVARAPMTALIGVQCVWGGAAYFIPAHQKVIGGRPAATLFDFFSSGYRDAITGRLKVFGDFADAGRSTPKDAKILLHRFEQHAGLARAVVMDHPSWQGLISYGRLHSEREVFDLYRRIGVTHVMWENTETHAEDSLAGDLRFHGFVSHVLPPATSFGGLLLAPMPAEPPSADVRESVLYLGCSGYGPGLYELGDLSNPGLVPPPATGGPSPRQPLVSTAPDATERMTREANYVVFNPRCGRFARPASLDAEFTQRAHRIDEQLWVRTVPLLHAVPLAVQRRRP